VHNIGQIAFHHQRLALTKAIRRPNYNLTSYYLELVLRLVSGKESRQYLYKVVVRPSLSIFPGNVGPNSLACSPLEIVEWSQGLKR
jgi:hypothetical protein